MEVLRMGIDSPEIKTFNKAKIKREIEAQGLEKLLEYARLTHYLYIWVDTPFQVIEIKKNDANYKIRRSKDDFMSGATEEEIQGILREAFLEILKGGEHEKAKEANILSA